MKLPEEFRTRIVNTFPEGASWIARLPDLVREAAARWHLQVDEAVPNLSYNYVAPALRVDGTDCILKIGVPNRELTSEISALQIYAGEGACCLYEADAARGMLLVERLHPGMMLHEYGTQAEQTELAAGLMKRLWKPAPLAEDLLDLQGWFDGLKGLRRRFHGGTGPFPERLVGMVETLLPELQAECRQPVLLHGDCHHFNILSSGRGWLVIDPKGVIGAAEYEPAPFLINPWDAYLRLPNPVQVAEERIRIFARVLERDARLIHAWAVCHCLLSAWWDLDDSGGGIDYPLACAGILLQVKL